MHSRHILAALSWFLPYPTLDHMCALYAKMNSGVQTCALYAKMNSGVPLSDLSADVPERWWEVAQAEMERAERIGVHWVSIFDESYPQSLLQLECPPPLLSVLGRLPQGPILTVVGSRRLFSERETFLSNLLTDFLRQRPVTVMSGGARGVDQLAHRSALKMNLPTTAWLPSGILNIYPPPFQTWTTAIVQAGGCVLSPFSPSQEMRKQAFHFRNSCVAAMSDFVLIGSATIKSGTMVTARWAADLDKPVGAVPGDPWSMESQGCNSLLCDGAYFIRSAADLIAAYDLNVTSDMERATVGVGSDSASDEVRNPNTNKDRNDIGLSNVLHGGVQNPVTHNGH